MRSERGIDVERQPDVGVDVHAFLRREGDGLVRRAPFIGRCGPHDVLHARGKLDDLFGEGVEKHPPRHDRNILHAASAARELDANADVADVDARHGRRRNDEKADDGDRRDDDAAKKTSETAVV